MRQNYALLLVLCLLTSGCAGPTPSPPTRLVREVAQPEAVPSRALILGVPFISFADAAALDYEDKSILNPSFAASLGMILTYWDQDLSLLLRLEEALPTQPGGWGTVEEGKAKDFTELKALIARGIPVHVSTAMTPWAHTVYPVTAALAVVMHEFKFPEEGPQSGVLGRMVSLETMRQLELLQPEISPWDSVLISDRVVIGYDDDRKVVVLHDPSFGPGWEVGYDDFEKMWEAKGKAYLAPHPPSVADILAKPSRATPYRPRSPDEQGATHYVFAYSLSAVGRAREAEIELVKGLRVPGISRGIQHLLLFEIALHQGARGRIREATQTVQEAIALLPEHHRPWEFLAIIQKGDPSTALEVAEAERKAKAACADRESQRTAIKTLTRSFWILGCRPGTIHWGPEE
jgi:hypothetical protein